MVKTVANQVPKTALHSAHKPGQMTYGDYSGKHIQTVHGETGFSLLIDELTRWVEVSLTKAKNEVQSHFKYYQQEMKNRYGVTVSGLRTDSASEYIEDRKFVKMAFRVGSSAGIVSIFAVSKQVC
jgi:hypothetical protein